MRFKAAASLQVLTWLLMIASIQAEAQVSRLDTDTLPSLFGDSSLLETRMHAPLKRIRTETKDSGYLPTFLAYRRSPATDGHRSGPGSNDSDSWDSIAVGLQARGNFRLDECFYPPLKVEFHSPDLAEQKPFAHLDKAKLVLPCAQVHQKNDYVLKEYLAYRMFALLSPYHLKTRLSRMDLIEEKNKSSRLHKVLVFFLETNGDMAERYRAKLYEQKIHPMQVDTLSALRNSFFQFMIGNTDYSLRHDHNRNILFLDKEFIVVPYDFDMSGFVNTNYSTVSNADNLKIIPTEVTERSFKGYQRSADLLEKMRREFLSREAGINALISAHEVHFESKTQFEEAQSYILGFFRLLKDDKEFEKYFVRLARDP